VEDQVSGLARPIVVNDEIEDRLLQLVKTSKMVGLQELALQKTEPDLDLVKPRGVRWYPRDLERQLFVQAEGLFF
jgi:hypothetical protein